MSDTPETDAETMQDEWDYVDTDIGPFAPSTMVSADFARGLERERDEAREKIQRQRERIAYLEGATHHACGTPLSKAIKERDEAQEIIRIAKTKFCEEGSDGNIASEMFSILNVKK
jgi:hypothetical protein